MTAFISILATVSVGDLKQRRSLVVGPNISHSLSFFKKMASNSGFNRTFISRTYIYININCDFQVSIAVVVKTKMTALNHAVATQEPKPLPEVPVKNSSIARPLGVVPF